MRWLHTLQGGRYLFGIHGLRASQLIKMSNSEHTRPVLGIRTGFTVGTDANTDQLPSNLYSKGSHLTFYSPRKPSGPWPRKATQSGFLPHSSPHQLFLHQWQQLSVIWIHHLHTHHWISTFSLECSLTYLPALCLVNPHSSFRSQSIIPSRETSWIPPKPPCPRGSFVICPQRTKLFSFLAFELSLYCTCLYVTIWLISTSLYWNVTFMKVETMIIFDYISLPGISTVNSR